MEFLIRSAEIIHSSSSHHKSKKDILISNGIIKKIDDKIDFDGHVISSENLKVSAGWLDFRVNYNDPGLEHKEDLDSGCEVAMAGGFTDVLLLPNTDPVVSTKNGVSYYQKYSKTALVNLHSIAAVTQKCKGEELTEMIDLHTAGAVAFSDGLNPIWHTDILIKSLQYLQKFDGVLINKPEDKMLTGFAHMHEGANSTMLGMKGMPSLSEVSMIERDLRLLEYAGGKLHFTLVSTAEGVELIRQAKKKGLQVSCDVGVNYLKYTDDDLMDFDTNLKVNPPYRSKNDKEALIAGVLDGTIDLIVSDHNPQDQESKKLEFDLADFGSSNQQTYYSVIAAVFGDKAEEVLCGIAEKARTILQLEQPKIEEGESACFTLFDPSINWTFDASTNKSKSVASPLFNSELQGRVVGVVNQGMLYTNTDED